MVTRIPVMGIPIEVHEIWRHPYYGGYRSDAPEQFRAIGWVQGKLYSVIFEIREADEGECYHLVMLWKSTLQEIKLYEKTYKKPTADEIVDLAESGKDISKFFTNKGKMKYPTQRVHVDFTVQMLKELFGIFTDS